MTSHRCKLLTWRRTGAVTDGVHCHVWWLWDFLFILWLGVVMNDTGCVWLYLSFRLRLWNIPGFCRKMEAQTCMSESQYLVVFTKSWACLQLASFCLPSFFYVSSPKAKTLAGRTEACYVRSLCEWIQGSFGTLHALLRSSLQVLQWNSCLRMIETANWSHVINSH